MERSCNCYAFGAAAVPPALWHCPEHGRQASVDLDGLYLVYKEQLPALSWEEFWDIAWGVLASERVRCRVQGRHYFEEDYLLADVARHVETLAHRLGHPALAIPGLRPLELRDLSWWRKLIVRAALPPNRD